ncbi:hypothetical protein SMD44_p10152 (plasmid) [Streptomyces alboflavus]|uniref:Competence protein CoiA-like N-terminal domain-containing protein n=1 Tax=Streptomyces alboflavus TaxID=67267 RepID=A0A291W4S8_9ACTN|nr:hypothetical protein SMD44_p10152 [Streptomyces alboflavus]
MWSGDGITSLPPGMAGGRYRCRACRERLILKGTRPGAKVQPHFAHRGGDGCSKPEQEALLDAADEVVIRLREQIRALPGVTHCTTTSPGETITDPSGIPPAVLAQFGTTTVIIEAPTGALPPTEAIRHRVHAVHGAYDDAQHVWFLKRDLGQFSELSPHPVWLRGAKVLHQQVAPNEQQQAINAAGGHVYWLDGKVVLVPYGIYWFRHPVQHGQQWENWPNWRSDPREDWRISQPRPAPDAHTWGLVPIAFASLTRSRGTFRPADAHQVMDDLYTAQESRFNWRNQHARDQYNAPDKTLPAAEPRTEPAAQAPPPREADRRAGPDETTVPSMREPGPEPDAARPEQAGAAPSPAVPAQLAAPVIPPRPVTPPPVPTADPPPPPEAKVPAPRLWERLLRFRRRG